MTQEEKMLLIKDLSARLPYAVTVEHTSGFRGTLHDIAVHHMYDDNDNIYDAVCYTDFFGDEDTIYIEYFKPYLFPLSSMTKEQYKEWCDLEEEPLDEILTRNANGEKMSTLEHHLLIAKSLTDSVNYCYKNHFDIYGLIPKRLAIDATGLNIY